MSSRVLHCPRAAEITFYDYEHHRQAIQSILDQHWKENETWIQEEGEKLGFKWIVVSGYHIVAGGPNPKDMPTDQATLDAIGERYGHPAFAYILTPTAN